MKTLHKTWGTRPWNRLRRYMQAWQVDNLTSIRLWLVSDSYPTDVIDRKLNVYREMYHQAGAQYGATDKGMVKWFYERARPLRTRRPCHRLV